MIESLLSLASGRGKEGSHLCYKYLLVNRYLNNLSPSEQNRVISAQRRLCKDFALFKVVKEKELAIFRLPRLKFALISANEGE